jgi:hypothetical protein
VLPSPHAQVSGGRNYGMRIEDHALIGDLHMALTMTAAKLSALERFSSARHPDARRL